MKRFRYNKVIILYSVFVLLILGLIFYFSSNNGLESGAQSARVTALLMRIFGIENTSENTSFIHTIVRKMAHYFLFTLLGMGLFGLFSSINVKRKALVAALCGLIAASGDEIHQWFVPGRAGLLTDVIIDMCGVISGILFLISITLICKKIKQKNDLDV